MKKDTIITTLVVGSIFIASLALVIFADQHDKEQAAKAKQLAYEKWSQNDLFMNTLGRYNDVYHRLNELHEKEALALAYVEMLTQDLFLFPSKRAEQSTLNVLLPAAREVGDQQIDEKPFVLKEIYIGSDNGMYDALRYLIKRRHSRMSEPPPFIPSQTEHLLEYIKTGNDGALQVAKSRVPTLLEPSETGISQDNQFKKYKHL